MTIRTITAFCAALAIAVPALAQAPDIDAAQEALLEEKRAMIEVAKEQEFFFWERLIRRADVGFRSFPSPPGFYNPSGLVEGGLGMPWPRAAEAEKTISDAAWDEAIAYAKEKDSGLVIVWRDGKIEHEWYAEGYHPGSLVPVRSFTKALPAIMTGIAIAEGHIGSLDDPIGEYIEEWADDPRGELTIRSLNTWSSGLDMSAEEAERIDNLTQRLAEGSNINQTALEYSIQRPMDSKWTVAQVDNQLAGLVVQRATGMDFREYVSSRLWRKLGNGTATMNLDADDGDARTFCCMRARPEDWVRVAKMLMDGGRWQGEQIVPEDYVAEMLSPSAANPYIGLSVWIGPKPGEDISKNEDGSIRIMPHSEPYLVEDVHYLMGGFSINLWFSKSQNLIAMRWGADPQPFGSWDASKIPNILFADLLAKDNAD